MIPFHNHPINGSGRLYCFLLIAAPLLLQAGCAHNYKPADGIDFSLYSDGPLPPETSAWLGQGEQSKITPPIAAEAALVKGANRRERLFRGMGYIWKRFAYDRGYNQYMLKRTAGELFDSNILGGCSDFALVESVFFRALGIPARLVVTANTDWIAAYRFNPLSMTSGHTFVEVYLEDRWHLVDSTFRILHSGYDAGRPYYPHNEIFCRRGRDFPDMGIRNVEQLDEVMRDCIRNYTIGSYKEPSYEKQKI